MNQNDDPVATLIRAAGKRARPDAAATARIRAAVEAEWQSTVRRRRITRWGMGAVAAAAMLALMFVLLPQGVSPPTGEAIVTANAPRSVDWNGNTLRLDANSRVVLLGPDRARLERGTLYFSSEGDGTPVTIATTFGDVHDIGTQFELRLTTTDLEVRVREGRVELRGHVAAAGQMLVATADRITLGRDEKDWTWVARAAPPIRLEGMRVEEIVHRAAREKGLTPEWHDAASKRSVVLRGDITLPPEEALDAAAAAAGITWRVDGRLLVIEVQP